jgi:choline-sulfatase
MLGSIAMGSYRIILSWLFLGAICAAGGTQPSGKQAQSDVFLITIDTLRADHVHCYGYDRVQTPALDALAKDGVRFTHAFTPSPITNTSHVSILTGLLPSIHGVTDFAVPLAATHPTAAELLKKSGYQTAAFIGAVILDSKSLAPGLDRGFDFYDSFPEHSTTKSRWGRVERRGMEVVQHTENWLNAHHAGRHFVWLHLYDPHDPYEPPPPYSQLYKDHLYDGEIAYADSALAKFIGYLKQQGWYENSLVIVVGDHGEGLREHNEETHGIFLYDATTHVPLIVKPARVREAGKVVNAQVRTTDILPTILEIVGSPRPERLDGESLGEHLVAAETASRTAFGETDYPLRFGWAPLRSVREPDYKFIEAPRPELYDLRADPGELKNIYDPRNAVVQSLQKRLADLKANVTVQSSAASAENGNAEQLRSLGYQGKPEAASAPSLLPDPKDKIQEQNLLHRAMIASEDNRPAEARAALEEVLQLNPKSATALLQLGELEMQAAQYARAAEYLGRAREVRPEDATAAYYQGQALEKIGNLAQARDALEASLKLTPGQFPARLLLGNIYLGLKNPKAAEDQFEAALLLQDGNVEAQLGLAKAMLASGSFKEAAGQLKELTKSHPNNADAFELLARSYKALGNETAAQQADSRAKLLRARGNKL